MCQTCRYWAEPDGCRRNVCAAVRALRLSRGLKPPAAPVRVAGPEPTGPNGEVGYLVMWGSIQREFPPTKGGLQEAMALVDELGEVGITASMAELHRGVALALSLAVN